MKIVNVFLWIIIGALILWFFSNNIDKSVDINILTKTYEQVKLYKIIFISVVIGVIIGATFLAIELLKARAEIRLLRKEKNKMLKELDGLRNLTIDEIPDSDTQIGPEPPLNL
jgi:uncharacterized integral membrane protein